MSRLSFAGKRILVTGAGSGVGRATAIAAAKQGAELFLTSRTAQSLADTAGSITQSGGVVREAMAFDIDDYKSVIDFAALIHQRHGPLDIVCNVAGISAWGTVDRLTHHHWRTMVDVNLMGPIHVIEAFIPEMISNGRPGALVNVSSAAGELAYPWHAAYSASKFGLCGLSEVLRFDLARHNISVHLVIPGAVDTPLVDKTEILGIDRNRPDVQDAIASFKRHAVTPESAAEAILGGVQKGKFLIYTSNDIRALVWCKHQIPPLYRYLLRAAGRKFTSYLSEPTLSAPVE